MEWVKLTIKLELICCVTSSLDFSTFISVDSLVSFDHASYRVHRVLDIPFQVL